MIIPSFVYVSILHPLLDIRPNLFLIQFFFISPVFYSIAPRFKLLVLWSLFFYPVVVYLSSSQGSISYLILAGYHYFFFHLIIIGLKVLVWWGLSCRHWDSHFVVLFLGFKAVLFLFSFVKSS